MSKSKIDHETTQDLIQNPDSYNNYLRRIKDLRTQQESKIIKEQNTPGSGKVWKNKLTIPKSFQLGIRPKENSSLNESKIVRSLNKV